MMKLFLLAIAVGCSDSGTGEVISVENAPWSMDGAASFLFTPGPDNDGEQGNGTLTIATDATVDCIAIANGEYFLDSGLSFDVGYFTSRTQGSSPPAWNGLYATGMANSAETGAFRTLAVGGWHKGFEYTFSGQDAWLEVTRGAQDQFAGTFATQWWSGNFDAQVCEKSDLEVDESDEG
jgi:hypothetical protein